MTFPSVVSTINTNGAINGSYALTMPSGISSGNLLVAWVAGASITGDAMTGWTKRGTAANGNSDITIWTRIATGTDTGTVTGSFTGRLAMVKEITGWDGILANIGMANATTNVVDPPSLNMTTSRDHLWLAYARNDSAAITAAPTNYSPLTTAVYSPSNLAVAERALTASTEDPGAFTTGTLSLAVAGVIAIRPSVVQSAAATFAASATVTASGNHVAPGAATIDVVASLTATAVRTTLGSVALSAASSLTASGSSNITVSLTAISSLSSAGVGETTPDAIILAADSTLLVFGSQHVADTPSLVAEGTLTVTGVPVRPLVAALVATSALTAGSREGQLAMVATSILTATPVTAGFTPLTFLDMSVTVTPPEGHFEPFPLTLGASWRTNDTRLLLVSGSGVTSGFTPLTLDMPMSPDPPTGFTSPYTLDVGQQTHGVYYRSLLTGDLDTSVAWPKPPSWRYFMWATLTARGVDPAVAPVAGKLRTAYHVGDDTATVSSVTVPSSGTMLLFLGTFHDPEGNWPSWASSLGIPAGWRHVVATDKSGTNFYPYDSNPAVIVVGKTFSSSGTTGTISVPVGSGAPAFFGMYCFLRPASDVSIAVGAA